MFFHIEKGQLFCSLNQIIGFYLIATEAVARRRSVKKVFSEFLQPLAQVFSCEFCETSQNIFYCRTPPVSAPVKTWAINPFLVTVPIVYSLKTLDHEDKRNRKILYLDLFDT